MSKSNTQEGCAEIIKQLEGKVNEYETVLGQVFEKFPKRTGVVMTEPYKHDEIYFITCDVEGDHLICSFNEDSELMGEKIKVNQLTIGTRVLIMGNLIASILPEILEIKKTTPEFDLIDWSGIGGHKSQIKDIRSAIELPLLHAKEMKEFGMTPPKGVLLYGEAGCGKTLIAKAIASTYLNTKKATAESFVYVKGAELLSKYVGEAERNIGNISHSCREYAKKTGQRAVLFIDEAEAILPRRGSRTSSDVDTTIVPTFLSEMDGFEGHTPLVILSTNFPNQLDDAIVRPGRIDLKVHIGRPTVADSIDIFKICLNRVKCADKVEEMAHDAAQEIFKGGLDEKISGAAIATIVNSATQKALVRKLDNPKAKSVGLTREDLLEVINSKSILS